MAKAKKGKANEMMGMGIATAPSNSDNEYQVRDDVDTIMRHEHLKTDKRRYNRASSRLKTAVRSLSSGR